MSAYPDATQWLITVDVDVDKVDSTTLPDATTGARPVIKLVTTKTYVFDEKLQK